MYGTTYGNSITDTGDTDTCIAILTTLDTNALYACNTHAQMYSTCGNVCC